MKPAMLIIGSMVCMALLGGPATAQSAEQPGTEEFGLSPRQLAQYIDRVETLISKCMREQGFQYVAVDFLTLRKGMSADKSLPGMNEAEFISKFGYGIATLYTGKPPQLNNGYSPGRVGLGKKNVEIFKNLSPADQVAYNRTLFGDNPGATFAVGLETENFSRTGGCTRTAIGQVFKPEELKASYYNPKDALINKHPKMQSALRYYARQMRKAGYAYNHPDEVEPDIWERLAALTDNQTLRVEDMSAEQRADLKKLQDYERRVAAKNYALAIEVFDPVEARIEEEMYARKVK